MHVLFWELVKAAIAGVVESAAGEWVKKVFKRKKK